MALWLFHSEVGCRGFPIQSFSRMLTTIEAKGGRAYDGKGSRKSLLLVMNRIEEKGGQLETSER